MPLLRKIFFYLFALVYLVICPLLILRLLGFVRDPQTHHWVKTGLIYVSSNPPGATVYLNTRRMPEATPTIIRDLVPGKYNVGMELAGYEPWENIVPVVDKKATSVENILLIPSEWRIKTLSTVPLTKLIPMSGNNFLLAAADDTVKGLLILQLNKDIEEKNENDTKPDLEYLFPEESIYRDAKVIRYFTIEKSPFFVLQINTGERDKYLWIDPRDKQMHIEDLSDLLPQSPQKLYWEPNEDRNIFAFYNASVNRINIKEKAIFPNIQEKDVPLPKKPEKIISVPAETDQMFLVNNGNTLLFRRGKNVFLMDEESFNDPRLTKVLKVQEGTDVYFAEKTGKMYYIDDDSHVLSSVQILRHRPFIPKPVAETLRLKELEK